MNKEEFLKLLDRYLAGNSSKEEEQFLFDIYQRLEDKYQWNPTEMNALEQLEHKLIRKFAKSIHQSATKDQFWNFKLIINHFNNNSIYRVAAAILIFLGIGLIYWSYQGPSSEISKLLGNEKSKKFITYHNNTSASQHVIFPDKSYVILSAGSKVVYVKDFSDSLRQVYLVGEGDFQVTKNHSKSFIVFTDKVVVKVLGTSFIVKSGWDTVEASVLVKTGKVSVFRTKDFTAANTKANLEDGVILLPNHSADLNQKEELEKKLSVSPEILTPMTAEEFDFDNTPIDKVFSILQDSYGIDILYDKDKLHSCSLSVKMGRESFYQKLDIICRTINASYQVTEGKVIVSGMGCSNTR